MAKAGVDKPGGCAAPRNDTPWWVRREDFGKLEPFGSKLLTDRFNGWLGLALDGRNSIRGHAGAA